MVSASRIKWLFIPGGMLWLIAGWVLSLRPPGNPPHTFRKSSDLIPFLGVGLLLIGLAFGYSMYQRLNKSFPLLRTLCLVMIASSFSYLSGILIRKFFLNSTGWEPFMPLGFLFFVISWLLFGILCWRKKIVSRALSVLILLSAISLLSFNDQFNPYSAILFGSLVIAIFFVDGKRKEVFAY